MDIIFFFSSHLPLKLLVINDLDHERAKMLEIRTNFANHGDPVHLNGLVLGIKRDLNRISALNYSNIPEKRLAINRHSTIQESTFISTFINSENGSEVLNNKILMQFR